MPDPSPPVCPVCAGQGVVRVAGPDENGHTPEVVWICPDCQRHHAESGRCTASEHLEPQDTVAFTPLALLQAAATERDGWKNSQGFAQGNWGREKRRAEAAEAERDRLRGALERVAAQRREQRMSERRPREYGDLLAITREVEAERDQALAERDEALARIEVLEELARAADVACRELAWWTLPIAPPDELAEAGDKSKGRARQSPRRTGRGRLRCSGVPARA